MTFENMNINDVRIAMPFETLRVLSIAIKPHKAMAPPTTETILVTYNEHPKILMAIARKVVNKRKKSPP